MRSRSNFSRAFMLLLMMCCAGAAWAQEASATKAKVQFVEVQPGVKLEVLDWGGSGRPLVFLAGLGNTAHIYENFAPQFTDHFHVYGITRRGFGASSKPEPTVANYSADRLGEDVVAAIDALHLKRPVLAGHSIAGEELSWVGSHDPQKVAGLIYLDAAASFAYYDATRGNIQIDLLVVLRRLDAFRAGAVYDRAFVDALRESVAQLHRDLDAESVRLAEMPEVPPPPPPPPIPLAVWFGMEKFTRIEDPAIAIFACPHDLRPAFRGSLATDVMAQTAMRANDLQQCTDWANSFERANPADPVVRIADASHYIFLSNSDAVERAMRDFVDKLPAQ